MNALIPIEQIERRIYLIRGQKVMIDSDLAEMYGVAVPQLNRQVRRNPLRFPEDFAFQLTKEEWENLKCQKGIARSAWGGSRHPPYVFSESGVGMLASVLSSERAALVNVAIIRAFVRLRQLVSTHKELALKLGELEKKLGAHDSQIRNLFEAIRQLMTPPAPEPKRRIGYGVAS
jgi:hypothetical protein